MLYFWCFPKKHQWIALLIISYCFYAYFAGWKLFLYIIFTTCSVFFSARSFRLIKKPKIKKLIIAAVIISNITILAFFKWYNSVTTVVNFAIGKVAPDSSIALSPLKLILPLGISFYIFQSLGYLIDAYRKKVEPENNIFRFALFVSFFPQLIQGPISRYNELADQLYKSRKFNFDKAKSGIQLMLWGLFKKLVIADRLVVVVNTIFSDMETYKGLYILIGAISSFIVLYTDFSGGVDLTCGVAELFGIDLPVNFRRPFFSRSLPEFWGRWHITLNTWWRDYIFYPLILSKPMVKFTRFVRNNISADIGRVIGVYISLYIVRMLNAMWHGANTYFIATGVYQSTLIVLGLMLSPVSKKLVKVLHIDPDSFSWKLFQVIRTFLLTGICQIFWNVKSVTNSFKSFLSIFKDFNLQIIKFDLSFLVGLSDLDIRIMVISLAMLLIVEILQENGVSLRKALNRQHLIFQWVVLLAAFVIVIIWGCYGINFDPASFVYQDF